MTEEVWSWWQQGSDPSGRLADGGGGGAVDWRRRRIGSGRSRSHTGGACGRAADQVDAEEAGEGGHRHGHAAAAVRRRLCRRGATSWPPPTSETCGSRTSTSRSSRFDEEPPPSHGREARSLRAARPGRLSRAGPAGAGRGLRLGRRHDRGHHRPAAEGAGPSFWPRPRASSPDSISRRKRSASSTRASRSPFTTRTAPGARRARWSPSTSGTPSGLLTAERTALEFPAAVCPASPR